jgi:hypothetical protein
MGFVALGALGAFGLTRLADRVGRRRVLLACLAVLPALALASALASGVRLYISLQVLVAALYVTVLATTMVVITEELPDETRAQGQAYYGLLFSLGGAPVLLLAPLLAGPGAAGGCSGRSRAGPARAPGCGAACRRRASARRRERKRRRHPRATSSMAPIAGARSDCWRPGRCGRSASPPCSPISSITVSATPRSRLRW